MLNLASPPDDLFIDDPSGAAHSPASQTPRDLVPDAQELLRFLNGFRPGLPIYLSSLPVEKNGGLRSARFSADETGAALDWVRKNNDTRNIYFHVAQWTDEAVRAIRTGKKPKLGKGDVRDVGHVWVDIDPPSGVDLDEWLASTLAALDAFPLRPTFVLLSGGGVWAFWALTTPYTIDGDLARAACFERYTRGIACQFQALGGDKAYDVARLARLAGSVNRPDKGKVAKGRKPALARVLRWDTNLAYDIEQFEQWADSEPQRDSVLPTSTPRARIGDRLASLDDVPQLRDEQNNVLRALIETGQSPSRDKPYPSRSEAVFAATCGMIRVEVPDDVILSIITDDRFVISGHILKDKSFEKRAARTLENAHKAVARSPGGSKASFQCDAKGRILPKNMHNIRLAVERLGLSVRYNRFSEETLLSGLDDVGPLLDDAALIRIRAKTEEAFHFLPERDLLADVLADIARDHEFHPVEDYLDGLVWDGVKRADTWLSKYLGAEDTPLNRAIGSKFLVAATRRVRQPGCKFDQMPVFEGAQGTGKTTALRILARRPEWYCDDFPLSGSAKDILESIGGVWLVEIPELWAMKKGDIDRIKQNLSKTHDKARKAYARYEVTSPRKFVVAGTTNSEQYLSDPTGNRRFWPVRTGKIDLAALERDIDQLWAEAAERERRGEKLDLPEELWADAAQAQSARVTDDPWQAKLEDVLGDICGKVRTPDLLKIIGKPVERQFHSDARRIGDAMRKLGWTYEKQRFGGAPVWCWTRRPEGDDGAPLEAIEVLITPNEPGVPPDIYVQHAGDF